MAKTRPMPDPSMPVPKYVCHGFMALIEPMSEPSYPFMQSSWSTQQECFAVGGTGVRLTHGDKEHDAIQFDHRPRPCRGLVFGHGICQRDGRDFGILDIALRLQDV